MEIKTKYEQGSIIHFMKENKPTSAPITGIAVRSGIGYTGSTFDMKAAVEVRYFTEAYHNGVTEEKIFSTLEELKLHVFPVAEEK